MLRIVFAAWILASAALADQPVEVHVYNAATGAGIPDFPLRFLQYGQTLYSGATDASGRYRIESAKEGPYTVMMTQPGKYWPAQDSRGIGGSLSLQIAGGADAVRLEIGMYAMSKISGKVLDAAGRPVVNARVHLEDRTPRGGGMVIETNEKGEFSSDELWPSTFSLAATPPPGLAPPESPTGRPLGWTHTYYPSAISRDLAAPIVVSPGAEVRDMDIRLAAVPIHHVRGVVLDESGNPVPKLPVTLDALQPPALNQDSAGDGTFDIANAVDGECRLSAILDKGGVQLRAVRWVHVKGRDLENVELRLDEPFSIHGKVMMEVPEGAPAPKTPRVTVRSADMFGGFGGILQGIGFFDASSDGKGGFTIKGLYPGPYHILPGPAPAPYYLDSIRIGARDAVDAADASTQLLAGDLPLTVTYKLNGGTVRGTVEACASGSVLLVPQDPVLRRDGYIHRSTCDKDGRYEMTAVRPGEYYGIAIAADDPMGQQQLNGFLSTIDLGQNLINQSARITVRANEATLADLKQIKR